MKEGIYRLNELFEGNRIFSIPEYQRNYSWEEKQLEDFYNDVFFINKDYFLGTILLRVTGETKTDKRKLRIFEKLEVIDGQQRLTTVSIFMKSAIEVLESKKVPKAFVDDLRDVYISKSGFLKLDLLGDDAEFFNRYVIKKKTYPDETITPSQRRIKKAKEFFIENFSKLEEKEIKRMISNLANTRVLVYTVEEKGDAMLMFETINDRGKPLSNLEKTKSFLMYVVYISSGLDVIKKDKKAQMKIDELLNIIDETMGNIYKYIEYIKSKYNKDVGDDEIQRYHWVLWYNGDQKESSKYMEKLKEYFRKLLHENPYELLDQVEDYMASLQKIFYAFKEIFAENKSKSEELKGIILLGRVANFYPLILASWIKKKDEKEFLEVIEYIEKFTFIVFLIARKRSDTGSSYFYKLANEIFKDEIDLSDIPYLIEEITIYYVSPYEFEVDIKREDFYKRVGSKDARYIFYHYEVMLRKKAGEPLDINMENVFGNKYSIEHILAKELPKKDRPKELKRDVTFNKYVNRLGNLVLCSSSWNSSMNNKSFEEKKKCKGKSTTCYSKSIFKCQQKLADFRKFSKDEIEKREKELIDWMVEKWGL